MLLLTVHTVLLLILHFLEAIIGLLAGRECGSRIASYYTHWCRGLSQSDTASGLVHLPPPTCCVRVSLSVYISISENGKPSLAIAQCKPYSY